VWKRLIVLFLVSIIVIGCSGSAPLVTPSPTAPLGVGNYINYFPMYPGLWWEYSVEFPSSMPEGYNYQEVYWQMGDGFLAYEKLQFLRANPSATSPRVVLAITDIVQEQQLPVQYPLSVAIGVTQDDINYFLDTQASFFGFYTLDGVYYVHLLRTYSQFSPVETLGSADEGFSRSFIFYIDLLSVVAAEYGDDNVEYSCVSSQNSIDEFCFYGFSDNVPGFQGQQAMHFRRSVGLNGGSSSYDIAYTEDTWFIQNIGLVRLEQRSGDELNMVWTLTDSNIP
jgi:hypothetical protein